MTTLKTIPMPQDQVIAGADGRITPAWHRFFLSLPAIVSPINAQSVEQANASASLDTRIGIEARYRRSLSLGAGIELVETAPPLSTPPTQAELEALAARVAECCAAINLISQALAAASEG